MEDGTSLCSRAETHRSAHQVGPQRRRTPSAVSFRTGGNASAIMRSCDAIPNARLTKI